MMQNPKEFTKEEFLKACGEIWEKAEAEPLMIRGAAISVFQGDSFQCGIFGSIKSQDFKEMSIFHMERCAEMTMRAMQHKAMDDAAENINLEDLF